MWFGGLVVWWFGGLVDKWIGGQVQVRVDVRVDVHLVKVGVALPKHKRD
jgi:hypothetical protein